MRARYVVWPLLLLAALTSCAQLGLPTANTFQERLTAAVALNAEVRRSAAFLLDAKKLTVSDGQNVLEQTNNARAGLDIARTIGRADPAAGDSKLTSIRTVLLALQAYLATKQGAN
jgi:hypothetical protein